MNLQAFLATKPLFYKKFDPMRMRRAYEAVQSALPRIPIIHIVGTNGKGTTGRFLAGMLHEAGYKVGHYTSPHIVRFNERIWRDGRYITDDELGSLHERALQLLGGMTKELSYFEYTTFLAVLAFAECDYTVMEAGLGGEYDATAVFPHMLSVITPIDYDHQDFLGESIEAIAATKLRSVQKRAVIAPQPHREVYEVAKSLGIDYVAVPKADVSLITLCQREGLAPFFADNLATAAAAAKELGITPNIEAALGYRMPARMQRVSNVILDVGHNPLSARAIASALDKKRVLVYNTYRDKEYKKILQILRPKIKHIEILPIQNERMEDQKELIATIQELGLQVREFRKLDPEEAYLVYGSFSVIEECVQRCGLSITNI